MIVSNVIGATVRLCLLMRSPRYFDTGEAAHGETRENTGSTRRGKREDIGSLGMKGEPRKGGTRARAE